MIHKRETLQMRPAALLRLAILTSLCALGRPAPGSAGALGYRDQPPPLPGWTHTETFRDDTPQKHGIVLSGGQIVRSSPTIGEVDGNTANGREVVVMDRNGRLYVYAANGQRLWQADTLPSPCAYAGSDGVGHGSPAIGAIRGDSEPYVIAPYGSILQTNCDGGIAVYRGSNGQLAWRFSLRDWRNRQGYPDEALYGVLSSPAVADVDGDGDLEIAFGGFDRNVYLLNADGSVRFYYHTADTVWSSPAFADINGDGVLEMLIGTDITANATIGTGEGGYVYAFDTAARQPPRVEFCMPNFPNTCTNKNFVWRTFLDQVIYSSPVIADVLPANPGSELIVGSGCYFPEGSTNKRGRWLKILRLSDGAVLQTLNAPACLSSSAAVGDLDDDGRLEIAATVMGTADYGGDGSSRVMAWNPEDASVLWSAVPRDAAGGSNDSYGADLQSPVIADIDGNGSLEVMAANSSSVHVFAGANGAPLTCQGTPACGATPSMFTWQVLKSTPAVGDLNNDGVLDLVIGGGNFYSANGNGQLYAWTNIKLGSAAGKQTPYSAPWPMYRGNPQHTGVHGLSAVLSVNPKSQTVLVASGATRTLYLDINRNDGGAWTVEEASDPGNVVRVVTQTGKGRGRAQIDVIAGQTKGVQRASLVVKSDGLPDEAVELTVHVVEQTQIQTAYIPAVQR